VGGSGVRIIGFKRKRRGQGEGGEVSEYGLCPSRLSWVVRGSPGGSGSLARKTQMIEKKPSRGQTSRGLKTHAKSESERGGRP